MAVTATGLRKVFADLKALNDVSIELRNGEIHALLGANGSGKSTLARVLTGVYQPELGEITVGAVRVDRITTPNHANRLGIAVVHQEAPLIDSMTVAEGMSIFRGYPTSGGRVLWNRMREETRAMLLAFDVDVDPDRLAGTLSPAERALVAMVIALDQVKTGLELLILDEVTASLPERQAATFLDRVAAVARGGTAVLMVTHRLGELQGRVDKVTVLRNGEVVHSAPADAVDNKTLIATMAGPHSRAPSSDAASKDDIVSRLWATVSRSGPRKLEQAPVLQARNLAGRFMRDVSFDVHRGEILGVAGLIEGGINELPQVLAGTIERQGGTLAVNGHDLPRRMTPRSAIQAGLTLLPVDRLRSGGIGTLDLTENVLLPELGGFWHARSQERRVMEEVIDCFDVRPPDPGALFGRLSGGNQQKILLGKWLLMRPSVLVLEDPTSGVDPNARSKMFEAITDAARQGVSIIFFSTEPEQLADVCDRVLVLRDGKVATELTGDDLDQEIISKWSYA